MTHYTCILDFGLAILTLTMDDGDRHRTGANVNPNSRAANRINRFGVAINEGRKQIRYRIQIGSVGVDQSQACQFSVRPAKFYQLF